VASHHTKDKGDLGVYEVMADLGRNGIGICIPISEHLPFDLIAVSDLGQARRVQVKYRSLCDNGTLAIYFRSAYSDSNGYHERPVDKTQFDCYAVYCPDSRTVYYVRNDEIPAECSAYMSLRVLPPRNNQRARIRFAADYQGAARIFDDSAPVAQLDRAVVF
jgi:hypothetical protein